ncbi:MAG: hypothetical protein AAB425_08060, partial [Bdellovibrionota bacterium]
GSFPSFSTLAASTAPATKKSTGVTVHSNLSVSFTTTGSEITTAFDPNLGILGQVLLDAGLLGTVKSMYVVLTHAQSSVDTINTTYSDSTGAPTGCTAIAASTQVKAPFFDTATNAAFNAWSDAGKYTCYSDSNSVFSIFGRVAVAAPTAGCTDAFEYYVMTASSQNDAVNADQVATRGATVDGSSVQRLYFHGCSKDIKIAYAQSTKYVAGPEFSSRTEISGNADTSAFSMRSHFIDSDVNYASHTTIVGTGKSKGTGTGSSAGRFIMGHRTDNCGTGANSTTCTLGTMSSYCAANTGTANTYAVETDTTLCADLTTAYEAITPLLMSDLPSGYFEVSKTTLGL